MHVLYPAYLAERFPTEVRATASGFVYHQGAIFGGLAAPVITYFALNWHLGFAVPMAVGHYSRLHQRRPGGIRRPGNPWRSNSSPSSPSPEPGFDRTG